MKRADVGDRVKEAVAECLVSAQDYATHWQGEKAPDLPTPKGYGWPERREPKHDRRWFAGQGGRRRADRKI